MGFLKLLRWIIIEGGLWALILLGLAKASTYPGLEVLAIAVFIIFAVLYTFMAIVQMIITRYLKKDTLNNEVLTHIGIMVLDELKIPSWRKWYVTISTLAKGAAIAGIGYTTLGISFILPYILFTGAKKAVLHQFVKTYIKGKE